MNPYNVGCPTCGSQMGHPCTDPYGYPVGEYHSGRIDASHRPGDPLPINRPGSSSTVPVWPSQEPAAPYRDFEDTSMRGGYGEGYPQYQPSSSNASPEDIAAAFAFVAHLIQAFVGMCTKISTALQNPATLRHPLVLAGFICRLAVLGVVVYIVGVVVYAVAQAFSS